MIAALEAKMHKPDRTKKTYRRECHRLFDWLDRQRLHIFQLQRPDVNRYKADLLAKHSPNSVRLFLSSASSFFAFLEAERYIVFPASLQLRFRRLSGFR
jgi:site-specific recombinase XerD